MTSKVEFEENNANGEGSDGEDTNPFEDVEYSEPFVVVLVGLHNFLLVVFHSFVPVFFAFEIVVLNK